MTTNAEKIARLSPELRAQLFNKLSGNKKFSPSAPHPEQPSSLSISEDENFRCEIVSPGNFQSLKFGVTPRKPPGPGQVQIKAKAASLNFRDLMIAMNMYPATPGIPSNMGSDYAGVVVACGEGVTDLAPGDEVVALSAGDFGSENGSMELDLDAAIDLRAFSQDHKLEDNCHFSAYPNIYRPQVARKPKCLSFEEAAAVPTVFLTSYYALSVVAQLKEKERVLIHTATSGVGQAALQIATWKRAEIFATAGTQQKRDALRANGIAEPMDSRSLDFIERTMAMTGGRGVDVIFNTLSGEAVDRGLELLSPLGRFIQIDKKDIFRERPLPTRAFKNGLSFSAIDLALLCVRPLFLQKVFVELLEQFERGNLKAIPHKTFPIWNLAEALNYMSHAKHIGKLVLSYER